jgi:hypothetical protein
LWESRWYFTSPQYFGDDDFSVASPTNVELFWENACS